MIYLSDRRDCVLRTAEDNAQQFPLEVINTVKHNFYVDDCLKAMASEEEEAVHMINNLTALCERGGFTLSKWISNNHTVLLSVTEERRANKMMELDLDADQFLTERALGLQWCIGTDMFQFRTSVREQPQTR